MFWLVLHWHNEGNVVVVIKEKEDQFLTRLFGNTLECAVTHSSLTDMLLFRKLLTCEKMTLKHDSFWPFLTAD